MQAIILAGGLGTRLRPHTHKIPKSMMDLNGKPFLEHQIEMLKKNGISNFLLLIGHLGEQIKDYFGDGSKLGVSIKYSTEDSPLGTGGALKKAENLVENEFILLYGDSYLPINYEELIEMFRSDNKKGVVVAYSNEEDTTVKNNIKVNEDKIVTVYEKDSTEELDYVEAGVLVLKKKVLELIPSDKKVSLEEEVFPRLIKEKELLAYITNQRFYDIGTEERLEKIKELLK
jgi:NDP-sugar pyrophosphorylase family protein